MPNKTKKSSKVLTVVTRTEKKKKSKGAQGSSRKLTTGQRILKGAADVGLAYSKAGPLGAVVAGAGHLYEYLGDSAQSARITTVAAPVSMMPQITGNYTASHTVQSVGKDTIRIRGKIMTHRLVYGPTSYGLSAYDSANGATDYIYIDDDGNGSFVVALNPPAVNEATGYQTGFPRYLCPVNSPLPLYAQIYNRWRAESLLFEWIPSVPTSQAGSILMAWQADVTPYALDANGAIDSYGAAPYGLPAMSQQPCFASGPLWQSHTMAVRPREHGVCENPKDWLGINYYPTATEVGNTFSSGTPLRNDAGHLMINVSGMATPTTAYDLGFIVFHYDYTLHSMGPVKRPMGGYQSPEFISAPINRDLVEELKVRYQKAVLAHKGRYSSILYDLGHREAARKIRSHEQKKRVSAPPVSALDREMMEGVEDDDYVAPSPPHVRPPTPLLPITGHPTIKR